ncbi:hypothetical protein CDAR_389401 [Caerostris darwini]|uniref:Uncharacterized protein n=1 Tax=Caerostris darwini TaxID=1538125 RepID=A0AAV4UYB2_9ARAC|nr:hypothetical protein CDAR_389401 [Caerostris darwini]
MVLLTAMDVKLCGCIFNDVLVDGCLVSHYFPLCIDDCAVGRAQAACWSSMNNSDSFYRRNVLYIGNEVVKRNPSISTEVVFRKPIPLITPSGALHTTKGYILLIYSVWGH